jgi:hypothetical protein
MIWFPVKRPAIGLSVSVNRLALVEVSRAWRGGGLTLRRCEERALPEGLVRPSPSQLNIKDVGALAGEVRALLDAVPRRARAFTGAVSLPDHCARVALLEFEAWPRKPAEAEALIRWRFQKELNAGVGDARIEYRMFPLPAQNPSGTAPGGGAPVRVLALAVRRDILAQYERVWEQAGILPVAVGVTSLQMFDLCRPAMERAMGAGGDVFFAHVNEESFAFLALRDRIPLYLRMKLLRNGAGHSVAAKADEILATLQFYFERFPAAGEDRLQRGRPLFLAGESADFPGIPMADAEALGVAPVPIGWRELGVTRKPGTEDGPPPRPGVGPVGRPGRRLRKKLGMRLRTAMTGSGRAAKSIPSLPSVNLSLAARDLGVVRAAQVGLLLVILGALLTAGWAWRDSLALEEQAAQYEEATARVVAEGRRFAQEAARAGFDVSEKRAPTLLKEVTFANHFVERENFSWTRFLSDLEDAVTPRVSINSVAVSFRESLITLSGSTLTLKDLTGFVNELEGHRAFENAVLSQHRVRETPNKTAVQGAPAELPSVIEFTLSVTYRSGG